MKSASWSKRAMWRAGLCSVAIWIVSSTSPAEAADVPAKNSRTGEFKTLVADGRALFERDWSKDPPTWESKDGLGPLFNSVSCAACHDQGGLGGAGANDKNVDLLSARPATGMASRRRDAQRFERTARRLHPALSLATPNLVLHRFGTPASDYELWRTDVLGGTGPATLMPHVRPARRVGSVKLQLSQRNTPALFGAGIIDSIPQSVLVAEAQRQKLAGRVSGRVARTAAGGAGRFGWRGQVATLREFVLTACANELGLQTPGHPQPDSPVGEPQAPPLPLQPTDLTADHCNALTAFVASLPAPTRPDDWTSRQTEQALQGERIFHGIGCGDCHTKDLGSAEGIYSDLLLHDMGSGLSDPVPCLPDVEDVPASSTGSGGYGGGVPLTSRTLAMTDIHEEWRTPPLWGVCASAPYLHDGRAATLHDAILLHGGEGLRAAKRYRALRPENRELVLTFLASLVPPDEESPPLVEVVAGAVAGQTFRPEPPPLRLEGPGPFPVLTFGPFGFQFSSGGGVTLGGTPR